MSVMTGDLPTSRQRDVAADLIKGSGLALTENLRTNEVST
jgi:hypothetical protein